MNKNIQSNPLLAKFERFVDKCGLLDPNSTDILFGKKFNPDQSIMHDPGYFGYCELRLTEFYTNQSSFFICYSLTCAEHNWEISFHIEHKPPHDSSVEIRSIVFSPALLSFLK